jgi:hypothetical protein
VSNPINFSASPAMFIETPEPVEAQQPAWHLEINQLMARVVELCVAHGVEIDTFMSGAWSAYVEGRPGMRAQLEELQLRNQLEELRKAGRVFVA